MSALSMQTLGMLPDAAEHQRSALHLQTLGHLHLLEADVQPEPDPDPIQPFITSAYEGNTGGMNTSVPWGPPAPEVIAPTSPGDLAIIDEERVAARAFADGKSEILAVEMGLLMRRKK